MGLFNVHATFLADINLLIQIALLLLLTTGWLVKRRRNYLRHGIIMGTSTALHTVLIFIAMIPTLLASVVLFSNLLNLLALTILTHAVLGTIVEVLAIYLLSVWISNRTETKACFKNKKIMKTTMILWGIELVLGLGLYILLYLPA